MHVTAAVSFLSLRAKAIRAQDPAARIASETVMHSCPCTTVGEITTKAGVDYPEIARETTRDIGYDGPDLGFEGRSGPVFFRSTSRCADVVKGTDLHLGQRPTRCVSRNRPRGRSHE